jgi:hypothetical protein
MNKYLRIKFYFQIPNHLIFSAVENLLINICVNEMKFLTKFFLIYLSFIIKGK